MPTYSVEIIVDVACSGSYLGYTHLAAAADRARSEGAVVDVGFAPLRLDPDAASDGEPLLDALRRKFGEAAVQESRHVARLGIADGIAFDFDRAVHANMFEAHRLIASAAREGLAEPMVERLFRAHFADGLDVSDAGTLAALAVEVGVTGPLVDAEVVVAALRRVAGLGVRQIPVFRFGNGAELTGNRGEDELFAALTGA